MATIHNPTNFEPRDYEVIDYLDNRRPEYYFGMPAKAYEEVVKAWEGDMLRVLGADWRAKANHCVHCGNGNVRWITAVRHIPTREVVVFGSDCTDRLGFANKMAFRLALLKSRAEAHTESLKVWKRREEFLTKHPELREVVAGIDEPIHARNGFLQDVIAKLNRYGDLSDKQVAAVVSSFKRDAEFAARRAVEATEVKGDAPSGRVEVTGEVVSTKWIENDFGRTQKMLVKLTNHSKVWVSVPAKETIERGDTITIRATFEVSHDDKSFAFGKRPTLVSRRPLASAATPVAVETTQGAVNDAF